MLDTNKHICNISMHIVTKGLPKQSPLHRDDDTAFKNATAHTNTWAQGPQKQMDAKNKATAQLATRGNSLIFHDASFTKSWYLQGFVKS